MQRVQPINPVRASKTARADLMISQHSLDNGMLFIKKKIVLSNMGRGGAVGAH